MRKYHKLREATTTQPRRKKGSEDGNERVFRGAQVWALIIALALLSGCGGKTGPAPGGAEPAAPPPASVAPGQTPATAAPAPEMSPQGFLFEAYGQEIYICSEAAPILEALPQPRNTFEERNCAFNTDEDGLETTYFYPGFELAAYRKGSSPAWVFSIVFTDDSVTTPEGVYLGGTLESVKKAYGEGGEQSESGGQIIYKRGQGKLTFSLEDGIITGIVYALIIGE